jgi:adenylate kinase family enzyme
MHNTVRSVPPYEGNLHSKAPIRDLGHPIANTAAELFFGKNLIPDRLEGEDMVDALNRRNRSIDFKSTAANNLANHPILEGLGIGGSKGAKILGNIDAFSGGKISDKLSPILGGSTYKATEDIQNMMHNPAAMSAFGAGSHSGEGMMKALGKNFYKHGSLLNELKNRLFKKAEPQIAGNNITQQLGKLPSTDTRKSMTAELTSNDKPVESPAKAKINFSGRTADQSPVNTPNRSASESAPRPQHQASFSHIPIGRLAKPMSKMADIFKSLRKQGAAAPNSIQVDPTTATTEAVGSKVLADRAKSTAISSLPIGGLAKGVLGSSLGVVGTGLGLQGAEDRWNKGQKRDAIVQGAGAIAGGLASPMIASGLFAPAGLVLKGADIGASAALANSDAKRQNREALQQRRNFLKSQPAPGGIPNIVPPSSVQPGQPVASVQKQGSLTLARNTGISNVDGETYVNSSDVELLGKLGFDLRESEYEVLEKTSEVLDLYSYIEKIAGVPKDVAKLVDAGQAFSGEYLKDMGYSVPEGYEVKGDLCCPVEKTEQSFQQTEKNEKQSAERPGLWANIHAKRRRGEKAAKPGDEDYPDRKQWNKLSKKGAADPGQSILISGHSGAGKTTLSRQLAEKLNLPVRRVDAHRGWDNYIRGDDKRWKETLTPGTKEHEYFTNLVRRATKDTLKNAPESGIIEGTQLGHLTPEELAKFKAHIVVGGSRDQSILQRVQRSVDKAAKNGITFSPEEMDTKRIKAKYVADFWEPGVEKFRKLPGVINYNHTEHQVEPIIEQLRALMSKQAASAAWQRSEGKNPEGGLNAKGRASYKKETGGTLKAPVTESEPKGERAKRQNSFCSRMCGMKSKNTGSAAQSNPDSRINKSLRKWNCKCGEDHSSMFEKLACSVKEAKGRCWEGYEPVPGKEAYSEDSCRPKTDKKKKSELEKEAVDGNELRRLILAAHKGSQSSKQSLSAMGSKGGPRKPRSSPKPSIIATNAYKERHQGIFPFLGSHEAEIAKKTIDPTYTVNPSKYLGKQSELEKEATTISALKSIIRTLRARGVTVTKDPKAYANKIFSQINEEAPGMFADSSALQKHIADNFPPSFNPKNKIVYVPEKLPSAMAGETRAGRNLLKNYRMSDAVMHEGAGHAMHYLDDPHPMHTSIAMNAHMRPAESLALERIANNNAINHMRASAVPEPMVDNYKQNFANPGYGVYRKHMAWNKASAKSPAFSVENPAINAPGQLDKLYKPFEEIVDAAMKRYMSKSSAADHPLVSSNIKAVGYDKKEKELEVAFHSGGEYKYRDVPRGLYARLLKVKSPGKFFHKHIKKNNKYEFEKKDTSTKK